VQDSVGGQFRGDNRRVLGKRLITSRADHAVHEVPGRPHRFPDTREAAHILGIRAGDLLLLRLTRLRADDTGVHAAHGFYVRRAGLVS
jgi:hypothetical protein